MSKKKVLFVSESHNMASGFGTYAKQVLPRLAATGKYELAEFASYGDYNSVNDLDWLYFGNAPNNEEEKKVYDQNVANSFGLWRFDIFTRATLIASELINFSIPLVNSSDQNESSEYDMYVFIFLPSTLKSNLKSTICDNILLTSSSIYGRTAEINSYGIPSLSTALR